MQRKEKVYTLTESEIRKIRQDAEDEAFVMLLGIPIMAARDVFGAGKVRLSRFLDIALGWYEGVVDGTVRIKDIVDTLKKETGLDIVLEAKRGIFERRDGGGRDGTNRVARADGNSAAG